MPVNLSDFEKFEKWFAMPLLRLARDPDAGLIILMSTFPILERYLKEKSGCDPIAPPFLAAFIQVVPELGAEANAKLLWTTYRDQLLHNASFERQSQWLSRAKGIFEIDEQGRYWLNPALFAERVVSVIRSDFACFEMGLSLPEISVFASPRTLPEGSNLNPVYLGTGTPKRN